MQLLNRGSSLDSAADKLGRRLQVLRSQDAQIGAEIATAEETRKNAALGATDGDQGMQRLLEEAHALIDRRQRDRSDLALAINAIEGELAEIEINKAAAVRAKAIESHNQLLDERSAVVRRLQAIFDGLGPDLRTLVTVSDQIRMSHIALTRGKDERGVTFPWLITNPISPMESERRIGDQLFQVGVAPGLGGSRPMFMLGHSGRRYVELEWEAQENYRVAT